MTPYIIREALNNCIAHQDYTMGGKINVVENEDNMLIFANVGSFIPQSIENVIKAAVRSVSINPNSKSRLFKGENLEILKYLIEDEK